MVQEASCFFCCETGISEFINFDLVKFSLLLLSYWILSPVLKKLGFFLGMKLAIQNSCTMLIITGLGCCFGYTLGVLVGSVFYRLGLFFCLIVKELTGETYL